MGVIHGRCVQLAALTARAGLAGGAGGGLNRVGPLGQTEPPSWTVMMGDKHLNVTDVTKLHT